MSEDRAQKLAALEDQRLRWKGTISRWSQRNTKRDKRGENYVTVLLIDVHLMDSERKVELDHAWVWGGKWHHGLAVGDTIIFDATVLPYRKGYPDERWDDSPIRIDYRLYRISNVVKTRKRKK